MVPREYISRGRKLSGGITRRIRKTWALSYEPQGTWAYITYLGGGAELNYGGVALLRQACPGCLLKRTYARSHDRHGKLEAPYKIEHGSMEFSRNACVAINLSDSVRK